MLRSKEGPNQLGPIFPTLYIYFVHLFLITPLGIPITYAPEFFYSCEPHSRPHFTTPIRDLISRPTFVTMFCDSLLRLTFATPISDSL